MIARLLTVVWLFVVGTATATSATPTQRDLDEILALMQENFDACNRGDVKAVRATHHPEIPDFMLDQFDREAEVVFGEMKMCYRILGLGVAYFENPWEGGRARDGMASPNAALTQCEVEVVQLTLPAEHSYADLEEYPTELSTEFRHNSALLPSHQVVVYTVKLGYNYRAKKWQILGTISTVQALGVWPKNTREIMQGGRPAMVYRDCSNGQCQLIDSGRR